MLLIKKAFSFLYRGPPTQSQQVRHQFDGWTMLKDFKKRQAVKTHGPVRQRLMIMRKNKILPFEIQELAKEELSTFPRYSCACQLRRRCSLTSRPKGTINPYRVSRIVFRHLADYNKLAGVMRARW